MDAFGWIRIDPTPNHGFGDLDNKYVQLSNIRNNVVLNGYSRWAFTYLGDAIKVDESFSIK